MLLLCLTVLAGGCAARYADFEPRGARLYRARKVHKAHRRHLDAAIELVAELKYKEAAAKLTPMTATFAKAGDKPKAAEANFWLGYCREKLGNTEEAHKLYDLVARKYPDTPAARQAIARAARLK